MSTIIVLAVVILAVAFAVKRRNMVAATVVRKIVILPHVVNV